MKWPEIEREIGEGAILLFPTGVIEEHGPHMTLGVDIYLSHLACKLIKFKLEKREIRALIAPPYYWGINHVTGAFPGSFTVSGETMTAAICDILSSVSLWGVSRVFNINWHEDHLHLTALLEATDKARRKTGIMAYTILSDAAARRLRLTGKEEHVLIYMIPSSGDAPGGYPDIHAGSFETALMANYFHDEVDLDLCGRLEPTRLTGDDFAIWRKGMKAARRITPLGYLGNPAGYDREAGRSAFEGFTAAAAGLIEDVVRGNYRPPVINPGP